MKRIIIILLFIYCQNVKIISQIDSVNVISDNNTDGIKVIVYSVLYGCFNYDSLVISKYTDTSKTIKLYYTETYPQCDCECLKTDTINIGVILNRPYKITFKNNIVANDSFLIIIDKSTFVERQKENSIKIFPNPLIDKLNLVNYDIENKSIKIYNSSGLIVYERVIKNGNKEVLDLSRFHSGIYFLVLNNLTYKLIKLNQ
jgi:hypothetical protein